MILKKQPQLSIDLLRPIFKNLSYQDDRYSVIITLFSGEDQIAFEVSLESKEPSYKGSFPKRRYSLERHSGKGHDGVHVQINYHLIENRDKIGRLYMILEIENDEKLLEIAQGFVYTLREVLLEIDNDMTVVVEHLFNIDYLDTLGSRKTILMEELVKSLTSNRIHISDSFKKTSTIIQGKELMALIEDRKELRPLIGKLTHI